MKEDIFDKALKEHEDLMSTYCDCLIDNNEYNKIMTTALKLGKLYQEKSNMLSNILYHLGFNKAEKQAEINTLWGNELLKIIKEIEELKNE